MTPDQLRKRPGECWCCGNMRYVQARGKGKGLCQPCAQRWSRRGWEGPGPGPARPAAAERAAELLAGLRLHNGWQDTPPPGVLTARQAAERFRVSVRTIQRYKALREAS